MSTTVAASCCTTAVDCVVDVGHSSARAGVQGPVARQGRLSAGRLPQVPAHVDHRPARHGGTHPFPR